METVKLDILDQKLLTALQTDCRQTTKMLSLKLNLSTTAVHERIKKLEKSGVIAGYVAIVDQVRVDKNFVVFCHIKLQQHKQALLTGFEQAVSLLPEVLECYHVSGDYDYILKIAVRDMEAYRKFLVEKLTTIDYIASTHSIFKINEVKRSHVLAF
ncbi:Lrp/AsnC family transcriptional regulator [Flavobacterium sp.]|jgi:Lrp/AsnC family leucine-responsive transcriptional regulator|uniref:Lrp/AsnC family transcriptional regulator n=1 Tax=Flavobacterium sp. TaxID=239 RepID=UPI00263972AA|nr:Lrp/AsnC family transcriptional regulator [Flavobacterium sp.]